MFRSDLAIFTPEPESAILSAFKRMVNTRPSEADYAKIGKIALQHTGLEYQIEALVWTYIGDTDKGHIATAKMGMTQKIDALKTLVEWTEPDDGIADAIEWAIKCFEVVRENRNSVVHGYNFKADNASEKLFIEKRKPGMVFDNFLQFEITSKALAKIVDEQVDISSFLYGLQRIIDRRGPEAIGPMLPAPIEPSPLPRRCSLPSALVPLPNQVPQSARRQRKSSQEMEVRAAKAKRKDTQREAQKKKNQ